MHYNQGRQERMREVLDRATTDLVFRQKLLAEPIVAIRDAFGVDLPATFRIRFIEKGSDVDALIVLPDVAPANGELNERDLESVSGGGDWGWW